jgi:hypothetical protein
MSKCARHVADAGHMLALPEKADEKNSRFSTRPLKKLVKLI